MNAFFASSFTDEESRLTNYEGSSTRKLSYAV